MSNDDNGNRPEDSVESSAWDSDEALESLKMERRVNPSETNEALTRRLLEEAGPQAAQSIIHIALHDGNTNTRLRAAQFIADKVYNETSVVKQSWEDLVADTVSAAEKLANTNQGGSSSGSGGGQ